MEQPWRKQIPLMVRRLWSQLQTPHVPTYLVGGAVRDLLRGVRPHDYDLASSRTPEQVMDWAHQHGWRVIATGLRFGTVSLYDPHSPHCIIEHTTLRREGRYHDGRHPEQVVWTDDIEEDLARRDFTMNALALTWEGRLIDPYGGQDDLKRGIITCVGDAHRRLSEDPLRIWRALRFVGMDHHGQPFQLAPSLEYAIGHLWPQLTRISVERQRDELWRLLQSVHFARALWKAERLGLLAVIWPHWRMTQGFVQRNPYHRYMLNHHLLYTAGEGPTPLLRLAGLLHDIGKPWTYTLDANGQGHFYGHAEKGAVLAKNLLESLHFDHKTIASVTALIAHHMYPWENVQAKTLRRIAREWGDEHVQQLWILRKMDIIGAGYQDHWVSEEMVKRRWNEAFIHSSSRRRLAINGKDIMRWLNLSPGPEVGKWLKQVQMWVDDDPAVNDPYILKERILKAIK
ncbi:CCA tRNA nucleotidyltransferase [Sulfobacillus thermosulfidooxidans]|uniref:CCA tRNA nucleotidyltransferase n=1 Tax=Sulfobacillus thermosulfidooxidans TaxID=28034 RepID=UPI0006B4EC68|nr:HD domain-containing protein [Sulfobacillus thermosulfidooxidans]